MDCCVGNTGNKECKSQSTQHFPGTTFLQQTQTWLIQTARTFAGPRSGRIRSDQPLISSAFTAQASMQRSKMTFGFLQRTADNLVRLNDGLVSLLSQKNHLRPAGQGPVSAGMMLLERLSVDLSSSSSLTAFSIHQLIFSLSFTFLKYKAKLLL